MEIKSENDNELAKCFNCGQNFDSQELEIHFLECQTNLNEIHISSVHEDKKSHTCDYCGKIFKALSYLTRHISKIHNPHSSDKVKCDLCSKEFDNKLKLYKHVNYAHVSRKEPERKDKLTSKKCEICFKKVKFLKDHIEKVHMGLGKTFSCKICDKRFYGWQPLEDHISIHRNDKPHECNICDYKSAYRHDIKVHVDSTHKEQKRFSCDKCEKTFFTSQKLKIHLTTVHERKKNHFCEKCGKSYGQRSQSLFR